MDNAEATPINGKIIRITEIHDELCSWIAIAETYTEQHYLQQAVTSVKKIIEIANLKQEASENQGNSRSRMASMNSLRG